MAADSANAFTYADLEMSRVDAHLNGEQELFVLLPARHAEALVSLIETVRQLQATRSLFARLGLGLRGLYATAKALVFHRRLFELSRVLVCHSANATWRASENGQVLFRFAR